MSTKLTITDLDIILESLTYSKKAYAEYQDYPSNEFQQQQIAKVEKVEKKIVAMKSELHQDK